ncbi:hypothetical protein NDU88_008545 [Pleurodeles waltl]|uniref:Uncharacterized protein n=1 Tax=Pleurodeles waltl TaxID=8319 RepID=A0AAV7RUY2_PLEWA|nr:hypothetical protein NDU88_008545 [Pleurodeles waltl]
MSAGDIYVIGSRVVMKTPTTSFPRTPPWCVKSHCQHPRLEKQATREQIQCTYLRTISTSLNVTATTEGHIAELSCDEIKGRAACRADAAEWSYKEIIRHTCLVGSADFYRVDTVQPEGTAPRDSSVYDVGIASH